MYALYQAIILSVMVSSSYVYAIYVSDTVNKLPRNHPTTIKGRIRNVSISNVLILFFVPHILDHLDGFTSCAEAFKSFGLIPGQNSTNNCLSQDIFQIIRCLLLMTILYIGPILNYFLFEDGYRTFISDLKESFNNIWGIRNNIFAPITEEIIYTSVILSIFKPLSLTHKNLIIYTPILFGFAHLHHGFELYGTKQYTLVQVLTSCSFQFLYTTLFGMLTNFIFLRTGNIWCCIFVHSFCNLNGFPTFSIENRYWKLLYFSLLIYGGYLFQRNLYTLTA